MTNGAEHKASQPKANQPRRDNPCQPFSFDDLQIFNLNPLIDVRFLWKRSIVPKPESMNLAEYRVEHRHPNSGPEWIADIVERLCWILDWQTSSEILRILTVGFRARVPEVCGLLSST
jgi:hypothetical protein